MLRPRRELIKWSRTTKQTPNVKIGYPGQHLASLITGVEGSRTGARGHDLIDGSEVKSCSRIDQLDKCKNCNASVARLENQCPACGSAEIQRKDDSKWLFGIRSEAELRLLTQDVDRVLIVLGDHPHFTDNDFSVLRFQAWEIWPKNPRNRHFTTLMEEYYRNIYLGRKAIDPNSNPAPKNFWPYSFQFYMSNPIKVFSCTVSDADLDPRVTVDHYVQPHADRSALESDLMPSSILGKAEMDLVKTLPDDTLTALLQPGVSAEQFRSFKRLNFMRGALKHFDENARSGMLLRSTSSPVPQAVPYNRFSS